MHGGHRQPQRRRHVVAQVAKIGRQANPELLRSRAQARAGRLQGVQRFLGQIESQHGLVDLHPIGPGMGEPPEHLFVDEQYLVEQREQLELRPAALAQQQKRERSQQHGPGVDAQGRRLAELVDGLGRRELELHARFELGHDVVIVRVEPLGHIQGRDLLGASRHGEVRRQVERPARPPEPLRHGPEHGCRVEHVVVEREVVGGHVVDAQRLLQSPVLPAEGSGRRLKFLGIEVPLPILFDRSLQLASATDPGKAKVDG